MCNIDNNDSVGPGISARRAENFPVSNHTSMIRVRVVTGMHSGVFSNVLLDSGSGMSLVSIQFVQKLGLRSQPLQPGDNTHCIAANSEFVPITSKV